MLKLHRESEESQNSFESVIEKRFQTILKKRIAKVVTRGLEESVKQKAKKAAMAGEVSAGSHPRDKLKPNVGSPSRQMLGIPRPKKDSTYLCIHGCF